MGLERRGRVKRSHDRGNWKQEDFDACDRQAVRLACLLDGSRMSREVHVRFCERLGVQLPGPTLPVGRSDHRLREFTQHLEATANQKMALFNRLFRRRGLLF